MHLTSIKLSIVVIFGFSHTWGWICVSIQQYSLSLPLLQIFNQSFIYKLWWMFRSLGQRSTYVFTKKEHAGPHLAIIYVFSSYPLFLTVLSIGSNIALIFCPMHAKWKRYNPLKSLEINSTQKISIFSIFSTFAYNSFCVYTSTN